MDQLQRSLWRWVEPLLLALVVFAPWALNSEPIWCRRILLAMAGACSVAALLGLPPGPVDHEAYRLTPALRWFRNLALVLLAYVLVSAVNARATAVVGVGGVGLEYRECLSWLPHSYSSGATWFAWLKLLLVAGISWATWRWMASQAVEQSGSRKRVGWPRGLKRWIWVVSISSALMAVETILQRLSRTDYLLFFYPRITWRGDLNGKDSLGPFAYQGSGSAYFNLMWPLVLGFWWVNREREWEKSGVRSRFGSSSDSILPVGAILMAACPLISTSRTGAAICLMELGALIALPLLKWRRIPLHLRWGLIVGVLALGGFVTFVGWEPLLEKVRHVQKDQWGARLTTYQQVHRMIPDFDPWGSGAESFRHLSNLYTDLDAPSWESFVHDEWLEARLSYGWVGYSLIWAMILVWVAAFRSRPLKTIPSSFTPFLGVSIAGFLLDARFDIPLQTVSLHLIFAVVLMFALYSGSTLRHASGVGVRR